MLAPVAHVDKSLVVPTLSKEVRAGLRALREWVDASGFVQFYKYLTTINYYAVNPHAVNPSRANAFARFEKYTDGDFRHLALGAVLALDLPVFRRDLDDWQRGVADALVVAGLMRVEDGMLRMGRFQLISVHGLPLLVDARMNFKTDDSHEVYFGPDSALLEYYVHHAGYAPDGPALDLGTGTGYVPLSLSNHASRVVATDVAPAALELARMNICLNGREDRIELRDERYEQTLARGEKYKTITFNPPFIALPDELAGPIFAKGTGTDGLGWCRYLLDRFDDVVAPGGAVYIVADVVGDREQPFFANELRDRAEAQRLCIDLYIDGRNDYVEDTKQFEVLAYFLQRQNPSLSVDECTRRIETLHRGTLGAKATHLSVVRARRSTVIPPYCLVLNRFKSVEFGALGQ
jgi:hypothetical protein